MKFTKSTLFIFLISSLSTSFSTLTDESSMKQHVGDGGKNHVDFYIKFQSITGDECDDCDLCPGSTLADVFDPLKPAFCVDCGNVDDACNEVSIITTFSFPWTMRFVSIVSSDSSISSDPIATYIKGSNAEGSEIETTYEMLHELSNISFSNRNKREYLSLNNTKVYNTYIIAFQRNSDSSKMILGSYGIIEDYTKHKTIEISNLITGISLPDPITYSTNIPSLQPSSYPSSKPSSKTVPLVQGYGACEFGYCNKEKIYLGAFPEQQCLAQCQEHASAGACEAWTFIIGYQKEYNCYYIDESCGAKVTQGWGELHTTCFIYS